ncbi:MAG: DUF502 domain-containing protein [Planctomycetes bacterium]|nr:DUF502 domain-containing protein [Planctomycetota bacterium]
MNPISHVTRCLIAGIVALLPIGGTVLSLALLESTIAESWLANQAWYFPGLGILAALALVYAVGLFVTTFLGRWLWRQLDQLLERLPLLGTMYQSLKEVLGYDSGKERFFRGVVLVPSDGGSELGLVTGEAATPDGRMHTLVFVPSSPNPTNGRLVLVDPATLQPLDVRASDALRTLVAIGKTPLATAAD